MVGLPPGVVLSVPVELGGLSATLVARGEVRPDLAVDVVGPLPVGGGDALVTAVGVSAGEMVDEVVPVVEVSGRPVFVMEGSTPLYRQLGPQMSGVDVAMLQAGLVHAGCDAGDSGVFDELTKRCVDELYQRFGYAPARASETEQRDLAAGADAVSSAADAVTAAEAKLAAAQAGPSELELLDARQAVDTAGNQVGVARAAATRDVVVATQTHDEALRRLNRELVGLNPNPPRPGGGGGGGGDGGGGGGFEPPAVGVGGLELSLLVGGIDDVDGDGVGAGDVVWVSPVFTNVGEVDLDGVEVTVDRVGAVPCPSGRLMVGEQRVCAPVGVVLSADDLGRTLTVTATATGTASTLPEGEPGPSATVAVDVVVPGWAVVRLDKRVVEFVDVDGGGVGAGDVIVYEFVVVNEGNVPLSGVEVFDPLLIGVGHRVEFDTDVHLAGDVVVLDGVVPCGDPTVPIPVGEVRVCDRVRFPVRAEQLASVVENVALVTVYPPEGEPFSDDDWAAVWIPPACTTGDPSTTTSTSTTSTSVPPSSSSSEPVVPSTSEPAAPSSTAATTVPVPSTTDATVTAPPTAAPPTAVSPTAAPPADPSAESRGAQGDAGSAAGPVGLRRRPNTLAAPTGVVDAVGALPLPPCPPPSTETTTTTSTTTVPPSLNVTVPPPVSLPDATPDTPPDVGGSGGGGAVIIGGGGGGGSSSGGGRQPGVPVTGRVAAGEALLNAERGLEAARRDAAGKVEAAEAALVRAQATLAALEGDRMAVDEQRAVAQAEQRLARAEADLAALQLASGPVVRLGEVVFVPSLPARVDVVNAVAGEPVGGSSTSGGGFDGGGPGGAGGGVVPLVVLSSAGLVVLVEVPAVDVGLVAVGAPVVLLDELTGVTVDATVTEVGAVRAMPSTGGLSARVVVSGAAVPAEWSGRTVRVTFNTPLVGGPVGGGSVLVVPVAAVRLDAGGQAWVEVVETGGVRRRVAVAAGVSANGRVEVTPVVAGSLAEGDDVVIGELAPLPVESVPAESAHSAGPAAPVGLSSADDQR